MRDQGHRAARIQQLGQRVVAQHGVQRLHGGGGLATPQRQVVSQTAGQQDAHHALRS